VAKHQIEQGAGLAYDLGMSMLRSILTSASMLALLSAVGGCDPDERSDEGQYVLDIGLVDRLGTQSHHVLVGTTFELEVYESIGEEIRPVCVVRSGSGVVVDVSEGTFQVEGAGPGAVELADPSIACSNDEHAADFGPDRWSLVGVEASDVAGRWVHWPDAVPASDDYSPGPQGVFPDLIGRPIDDLRVVADVPFTAEPMLVQSLGEMQAEVRWHDLDAELLVPAHYDELRYADDGTLMTSLDGALRAGESFDASISILGTEFALPPVQAVPAEAIRSLELVPVYGVGDDQREWGPPAGVLAITRDGEGRRVIHAPVEFELTAGRLAFASERDVLQLADVCRREPKGPTAREATVVATLGDLEAIVDLEWVALPGDPHDGSPDCTQACSCTTATSGESTPAVLALFGLGVWLRRKRVS
jgi:MYXO-CTERM domain-containing protein